MDFSKLTERERLIAEQAVETLRALDKAADDAPYGQGFARMEASIQEHGLGLLRAMMTSGAAARPEGQKRGRASAAAAGAGAMRSSRRVSPARS